MDNFIVSFKFKPTDYGHIGSINLASWKEYQNRQGTYASRLFDESSDGMAALYLDSYERDISKAFTPAKMLAIQYLFENEREIQQAILAALFEDYPNIREKFLDDEELPEINDIKDLQNNIGLANVHIIESEKDGIAYLGFEFGCTWDEEHGAGVMMHKNRVVAVGGADTAILEWIAYRDGGSEKPAPPKDFVVKEPEPIPAEVIQMLQEMQNNSKSMPPSKPWWKFW